MRKSNGGEQQDGNNQVIDQRKAQNKTKGIERLKEIGLNDLVQFDQQNQQREKEKQQQILMNPPTGKESAERKSSLRRSHVAENVPNVLNNSAHQRFNNTPLE